MTFLIHLSDLHFFKPSIKSLVRDELAFYRLLTTLNHLVQPARTSNHLLKNASLHKKLPRKIQEWCHLSSLSQEALPDRAPSTSPPLYLLLTGDFSVTGEPQEFALAKSFLRAMQKALPSLKILLIPGNHDCYYERRSSYETMLEQLISSSSQKEQLTALYKKRYHIASLAPKWNLILLDLTPDKARASAHGIFDEKLERSLRKELHLRTIDSHTKDERYLIATHWPLRAMRRRRNELIGREHLWQFCLDHSAICAYLHGHTHKSGSYRLMEAPSPSPLLSLGATRSLLCSEPGALGAAQRGHLLELHGDLSPQNPPHLGVKTPLTITPFLWQSKEKHKGASGKARWILLEQEQIKALPFT